MPMSFKRFFEDEYYREEADDAYTGNAQAEEQMPLDVSSKYARDEWNQRRKAVSGRYIRSGRVVSPFTGLQEQAAALPVERLEQAPEPPRPLYPRLHLREEGYEGESGNTTAGGAAGNIGQTGRYGTNVNFGGIKAGGMEGELAAMEAGYGTDIGNDFAMSMGKSGLMGGAMTALGATAMGAPLGMLPGLSLGGAASAMFSPVGVGLGVADALAKSRDVANFSGQLDDTMSSMDFNSDDLGLAQQSGTGVLGADAHMATTGGQYAHAAIDAFEPRGIMGQLSDLATKGKGFSTGPLGWLPGIDPTVGGTGPDAAIDAGLGAIEGSTGAQSTDNLAGAIGLNLNAMGGTQGMAAQGSGADHAVTAEDLAVDASGATSVLGISNAGMMANDAQSKATAATMGRVAAAGLNPNMVTPSNQAMIDASFSKSGFINPGHLEQSGIDTDVSGISTLGGGSTGAGPHGGTENEDVGVLGKGGGSTGANYSGPTSTAGPHDAPTPGPSKAAPMAKAAAPSKAAPKAAAKAKSNKSKGQGNSGGKISLEEIAKTDRAFMNTGNKGGGTIGLEEISKTDVAFRGSGGTSSGGWTGASTTGGGTSSISGEDGGEGGGNK